jgi:hypothetical protein
MKILRIPDEIKYSGVVWVTYEVVMNDWHDSLVGLAELQIQWGLN